MVVVIIVVFLHRYKKNQPADIIKYFSPGLLLRVVGSFLLAFVYQYIYGGGDTFLYYYHAEIISSFFKQDVGLWWDMIMHSPTSDHPSVKILMSAISDFNKYNDIMYGIPENANVSRIAAVFNLICSNSYLGISIIFSTFSFLGCWNIFKTFVKLMPGYERHFAFACLFLPSLWFWGTGILKDPLCIYGLGIIVFNVFASEKSKLRRGIFILLGAFVLVNIKAYILYCVLASFAIAIAVKLFFDFNIIGKAAVIALFGFIGIISFSPIAAFISTTLEQIVAQSEYFMKAYANTADDGTGNVLLEFDPSPGGLAILAGKGMVNVYLRPFPWELRKIIYALSILENLLLYILIFKKIKIVPIAISAKAILLRYFALGFVLSIGFIIGVTTFNLGTISRYKVPGLLFLFSLVYATKIIKQNLRLIKNSKAIV